MKSAFRICLFAACISLPLGAVWIGTSLKPAVQEELPKQQLAQAASRHESAIDVHFSPRGGCQDECVRAIGEAKKEVLMQAYSFTNKAIAQALLDAHKRGVSVGVIMDERASSEAGSVLPMLSKGKVGCLLDGAHPIAHNKILVIDGAIVLTGSFNFTNQAEHANAENLLTIRNIALAERYRQNWMEHAKHSVKP